MRDNSTSVTERTGTYKGKGETIDVVDDRLTQSDPEPGSDDSDEPKYRDKQWLYHQYHVLGKSQADIAELCDTSKSTISQWMGKHGIPAHNSGKALSLAKVGDKLLWNEDWLREQYIERERSAYDIAEDRNVGKSTVYRALDRFDIPRRCRSATQKIPMERKYGDAEYNNPDWLKHQYHTLGKSGVEIADENGWGCETVYRNLEKHGIEVRTRESAGLNRWKTENAITEDSERDLVSSQGIDASWKDLKDVGGDEYVPYRDEKWLREKYHEDRLTTREISDICEVSHITVQRWLDKHGIETRGGSE